MLVLTVKITGKGKYAGKVSSSYTIKKATQKKLKVTNGYKKAVKASKFKKKAKSYTFKVSGVKDKAKNLSEKLKEDCCKEWQDHSG